MRRGALSVASLAALVGTAAASSGHYDSGHLAVMAVIGGGVALGSSALGRYVGEVDKKAHAGPEANAEPAGGVGGKVAQAAADVAAKVVGEGTPQGELVRSAYSVAKGTLTDPSAISGAAEGVTNVAADRFKAAVRDGVSQAASAPVPSPAAAIGTTARFCADCGTPTRAGARFCGSCGRKL